MKHRNFRGCLSFDAAPSLGRLEIDMAGIQLGRADRLSERSNDCVQRTMQSLGLWDSSSNNNNNFYPDVEGVADVLPKPEDFYIVNFRLLSATIVGAGTWKATDFTNVGELRKSMTKLVGKPVYKNHDMSSVDNWCGYVVDVAWEEEYTSDSGIRVPAGINGELALDAKSEPKLVRGVVMGSVYSNSVTVEFDWEMSHTFENMYDFLDKVGTYGSDGKMIRRICTTIYDYHETSMVFLGADPFAKLLDDKGELKNIDASSIEYSKADDKEKKSYDDDKKFKVAFGVDKNIVSLAKERLSSAPATKDKPKQEDENMKQFLIALAKACGVDASQVTEENYMSFLSKLTLNDASQVTELASLQAKMTAATPLLGLTLIKAKGEGEDKDTEVKVTLTEPAKEGETVGLSTELPADAVLLSRAHYDAIVASNVSLTKDAEYGSKMLNLRREECKRLYKLSAGENATEAVLSLMDSAGEDALEGLLKQYGKGASEKFGASCKKCGSNELTFASSVNEDDTNQPNKAQLVQTTSFEDMHDKFARSPMHLGRN